MTQSFALPRLMDRTRQIAHIARVLASLPLDSGWTLEVKKTVTRRSHAQNRLLWSLYEQILERGGEGMAGWEKEDLHDFFLIQHFGHEVREMFGRKRLVPLQRSSKLDKQQFADLVDHIVRFMASQGVCLDMPADTWAAAA